MKKALSLLILIFSVFSFAYTAESGDDVEITTIKINNARETNYKKDQETENDTIILEGSVEISVEKSGTVSDIKADKITYDRKTEMLYAEGNVEIETKGEGASGGEKTTANSLLLNTSTLEGIFDGGRVVQTQSDALNLPSGSTLIVFSDAFGKGSDNVIAFKNSSLTFCDDENPHWHIDATRTWLLPGGEFAFFNALLYVGPVPVLYLPAFYYPKDELVFNPVFSYKKRKGYSVQTTTYLHGRKGLDKSTADTAKSSGDSDNDEDKVSSEALYNFMKPTTLKEQRLEGLVLHNLDEDYKGDTSEYFKIMADFYSNLGMFLGAEGKLNPNDYISQLSFFLNLGFSKTLFPNSGEYYPYSTSGESYNDSSTFLGMTLPFRYGANIDFTLSKPFYLSVSLPIYSDPYFTSDFMNDRRESMDWISYLLEDMNSPKEDNSGSSDTSSFAWKINGSYSPSIPDFLRPYFNNLSLSLDSSINFSSKYNSFLTYNGNNNVESEWKNYTPSRSFYYPSLIKPVQFNANLSGKLFNWPKSGKTKKTKSLDFPITLNKPDALKSEKELAEEKEEKDNKDNNTEKEIESESEEKNEEKYEFYFPIIDVATPQTTQLRGLNYDLGYNLKTDLSTQIAYPSSNLKKPEDFDWNNIQSFMYTLSMPLSLTSSLSYGQNFFVMNNSISYNPIFQEHPYISMDEKEGGYTEQSANNLMFADYKAERQDINNSNTITLKPFVYIDMFKDTNISWSTNFKLYNREFIGTVDNPSWKNNFVDFTDDKSVTDNSLSLNIASSQLDNKFSQNLAFTFIMPPLAKQYKAKLNLTFPYIRTSLSTGFYEIKDDKTWKKSPLDQELSISLFNSSLSIFESYSYSLEENMSDKLRFNVSWKGMNLSYLMSYTNGYDFSKEKGWSMRDEKDFLPYSLSFSYSTPNKTFKTWSDKISFTPGLSTSIVADLIRPTNSYLLFTPSISFQITDFLTFRFSSTSKNSVLYWYFNNNPGDFYSEWGGFPGNIVKDLIDSFRFDDKKIRENSGFKLKSLNFDLEHDLHDWKLNMSFKIEPRVVTENNVHRYDFKPYFTLGVVWKPMDSLKTEIKDEYGEWEIK